MQTIDTIFHRHSITSLKPDPVSRNLLEKLLHAAVQAPNHYKVLPWRFIVLTSQARERLGDVMAESMRQKFPTLTDDALKKERSKPLRAPAVIAVGVEPPSEPKVLEIENIAAVAAACENILLAATELGLGAMWRTGDNARDPLVKQFLGLAPEQHLLGFIYVGYPADANSKPPIRPSYEDKTTWME